MNNTNVHHTYEHEAVVAEEGHYYHSDADHVVLRDDDGIIEEYSEKAAPPPKKKFYKTKKYWIICSINTVIVVVVAVVLALYVIFPKVAQNILNGSKIDVNSADISFVKPDSLVNSVYSKRDDDLNSTFYMSLGSSLSHTGPFSATIKFQNPVKVYFNESYLGDIYFFNQTKISGGKGTLNAVTPFLIRDEAAFASFATTLLAVEQFKWTLKGRLEISALTRTATVDLNKDITLSGMNGFPNVQITSFNLPADDPNGGIRAELGTVLVSPSPIGVQLGTIKMAIGYDGVNLGTIAASNVVLKQGDNQINFSGTLVPQNDSASLAKIGVLFSNYISGQLSNTTAVGLSCAPDGVNAIRWLSTGFESVNLNVGLTAGAPIKIINGISLGYLDLAFNSSTPYAPLLSAPAVIAHYQLPFGFTLGVSQVSQNVTLGINNTDNSATEYFATLQTPFAPATSDAQNGTIQFAMNNQYLAGIPGKEAIFNQYTYDLTALSNYSFMISGTASTVASTPIGNVTLTGVNITVPTTLGGLQFLNSTATTINSLDVVGGTTAGLNLAIDVTLTNPSDFSIHTGDVSFGLSASGSSLGSVILNNLTLARGVNNVNASSIFDPNASDVGLNLLSTFVVGQNNSVDIAGNANSTAIASLSQALGNITLSSTLPGLSTALVQGASLSIASNTIATSIAPVKVSIYNPFTAGLSISSVVAANTFQGMPLGNINQDLSSNPFAINGKTTGTSQNLDMTLNLDPANIALLVRNLAVAAGLDTRALDALLTLGGFTVEGQEQVAADSSLFSGFNLVTYVEQAMQALSVDLSVTSTITIGEYTVALTFAQSAVKVTTDSTIADLIPVVGQTIVQQIVDASVLAFDTIVLSNIAEGSFTVQLKGSITNTGPMDATISFPEPLNVYWQGQEIGKVSMANLEAKADVGAIFDVQGTFTVSDSSLMATFATYLINNADFQWEITSSTVSVTALGYTFTSVALDKFVTLTGANGFKNAVTVKSFDLPANDPAGGITLTADTTITNPSQIGFSLGGAAFETFFGSIDIGPLSTSGVTIAPQATSSLPMTGRLIPQSSSEGIAAIQTIFGNYLSGKSSTVTVKGVSGSGSGGQVSWLTAAFKSIEIDNVVLPGPASIPTLIPAIDLKNLQLDFTTDQWAPLTSSSDVEAKLQNPFGFPISVTQLDMNVQASRNGGNFAKLVVPTEPATTTNGIIKTGFDNIPFTVEDQTAFSQFNKDLTLTTGVTFGLAGSSNAIAETAVGSLNLPGITFNVDTTLAGFNNFGGSITINSLSVSGATPTYIIVTLVITINNPSQITITVGDINFDVKYGDSVIGKAYLYNATISPGAQTYNSEMHMAEGTTDVAALASVLTSYLTGATVPLLVAGSSTSTTIVPIQEGLSQVALSTSLVGINEKLIQYIYIVADLLEVLSGSVNAQITLYNPLDTPFTINSIHADTYKQITCDGSTQGADNFGQYFRIGTIDVSPSPPLTIQPKKTAVATWPVTLNADNYINQITAIVDFNNHYNVTQNASVTVGDGFNAELYYYQNEVSYNATIPGLTDEGIEFLWENFCPNLVGNPIPTNSTNSTAAPANATVSGIANATASSTISSTTTTTLTDISSAVTSIATTTTTDVITTTDATTAVETTAASSTTEEATTTTTTTDDAAATS